MMIYQSTFRTFFSTCGWITSWPTTWCTTGVVHDTMMIMHQRVDDNHNMGLQTIAVDITEV